MQRRTLRLVNAVFLLLGVAALVVLIARTGADELLDGASRVGAWFPLACAIHFTAIGFDSVMLYVCAGRRGRYRRYVRASLAGHGINEATPLAKLGEVTKYTLLCEHLPPSRAAAALIVQNLTMFVTGAVAIATSLLVGRAVFEPSADIATLMAIAAAVFAALAAGALVIFRVGIGRWPFAVAGRLGVSSERLERWREGWARVEGAWREAIFDRRTMIIHWSAGAASRGLEVAQAAVLLHALGAADGGALWAAAALSVASFQLILWTASFVPMQVGAHEAGAYALFAAVGLPAHLGVLLELARKARRLVFVAIAVAVLGAAAFRGMVAPARDDAAGPDRGSDQVRGDP